MKIDWYLAFAWLLVLTVVIMLAVYFTVNQINMCTSQPLEYAVKVIKEKFEVSSVYGTVTLMNNKGASDNIDFGDINISENYNSYIGLDISFP
jgi:hypothetical protein